jgi:hypothetical protein
MFRRFHPQVRGERPGERAVQLSLGRGLQLQGSDPSLRHQASEQGEFWNVG